MDIRIGVADHPRELNIEIAEDSDREAVRDSVDSALSGESPTLWLTDVKGREIGIPSTRLAWAELGPSRGNPIGFS